jgi:pyridoxamine 5'-phosphate oxidase
MTTEESRDVASWRQEYEARGLSETDLPADPISGIVQWLEQAQIAGVHEPNAMVVSSVDASGSPSSRMVLLKTIDRRGFVFYTNLRSRKGEELTSRPACALLFPWHPLERQVRVEGVASLVSGAEADAYFATRPRGSQIGAWASPQSQVVPSREFLEDRYDYESDRFASADEIPRPPQWGGFLVRPHLIEFWQGRPGRMHDRIRFDRVNGDSWEVSRLAP